MILVLILSYSSEQKFVQKKKERKNLRQNICKPFFDYLFLSEETKLKSKKTESEYIKNLLSYEPL